MVVEIISRSIFTKIWDSAGVERATPGSAVRHVSTVRHVTSVKWPNILLDFSLTVKAATLIFISGRGSAISSAK